MSLMEFVDKFPVKGLHSHLGSKQMKSGYLTLSTIKNIVNHFFCVIVLFFVLTVINSSAI